MTTKEQICFCDVCNKARYKLGSLYREQKEVKGYPFALDETVNSSRESKIRLLEYLLENEIH